MVNKYLLARLLGENDLSLSFNKCIYFFFIK